MTDRKYSPEEVEKIFTRAAELEASRPAPGESLSLSQLVQVARESGIDPQSVLDAADEVDGGGGLAVQDEEEKHPLLGAPTKLVRRRTIIVDPDFDLNEMVTVLNDAWDDVGRPEFSRDRLQWQSSGANNRIIRVDVRKTDAGLTVRIVEPLGGLIGGLFGGIGGGVGGGVGGGFAWLAGLMFGGIGVFLWIIFSLALGYLLARMAYKSVTAKRIASMDRAIQHIERELGRSETAFEFDERGHVLDLQSVEQVETSQTSK